MHGILEGQTDRPGHKGVRLKPQIGGRTGPRNQHGRSSSHPTGERFQRHNVVAVLLPAPVEYLDYVPDSAAFRAHTISDGPYEIQTYKANTQIVLVRNPAWKASTDEVRKAYVDKIVVTEGETAQSAQLQLQAGTADMEWDTNVPPQLLPGLEATKNPGLDIYDAGSLDPYLVFNFQSPNEDHATSNLDVRQAQSSTR